MLSPTDLVEGVTDYVMLLDHEWRIIYLNAGARRLLANEVQLLGRSLWDLFPKSDHTGIRKTMEGALADGKATRFQYYGPDLENWFDLRLTPLLNGAAIAFHDISDRRNATARLESIQGDAAARADRAISDPVSNSRLSEQIRLLSRQISQVASGLPITQDTAVLHWSDRQLGEIAETIYRDRRVRSAYFRGLELAEPQWDILLDLFVQTVAGRPVSVTSACIAADVPSSTGLRAIAALVDLGFVVRRSDTLDKRRTWLELTAVGKSSMVDYLKSIGLARSGANWAATDIG